MIILLGEFLNNVRKKAPLVHNITNYVTVNDCANILLACGASPVMSDDIHEVEDITTIANGLNINIGTLNSRTVESMLVAGKKANELNRAVLLDPVGAGASKYRTKTAFDLLNEVKFDVVRGNISEIKTLSNGFGSTHGVDADVKDEITKENIAIYVAFAKDLAFKLNTIIAISGNIDIVADSNTAYIITNGTKMMSKITGSGCMLSALTTAFIAANSFDKLAATVAAFCTMSIAGELAYERMEKLDGNASFRNYVIDAIFNMDNIQLETHARYEKS